jgi:hypothetical protein
MSIGDINWIGLPKNKVANVTDLVALGVGSPDKFADSLQLFVDKNKFPVTSTCNSGLPSVPHNTILGIG